MRVDTRFSRSFLFFGVILSVGGASVLAQEAVPTRDQIDTAYQWDLSRIYANEAAWEADYAKAERMIADLTAQKDERWTAARDLAQTLRLRDEAYWTVDRLIVYANQLHHQDMRQPGPQGLAKRTTALSTKY